MPPTPVAAPWYGSTALGWLCDSILNATASPSPIEMTPAFSPGPGDDALAGGRERLQQRPRALVRAVLAPHDAEHRELEVVRARARRAGRGWRRAPRRSRRDADGAAPRGARPRVIGRPRRPAVRCRRPPSTALSTSERMMPAPSSEPRIASAARSGWGIRPATLPAAFDHAGDRPQRAVGVAPGRRAAAPRHRRRRSGTGRRRSASSASSVGVVGEVAALAVGDRHAQRPAGVAGAWVNGVSSALARDAHLAGPRTAASALRSRAPARDRPRRGPGSRCRSRGPGRRRCGERRHRAHDRAEPGDHAGPQVVAVGEAARQDDRGDAVERRLLVPQHDRLGAGLLAARGPCRGRSCCPGRRRRRSARPSLTARSPTTRRAARWRRPRSAGSPAARRQRSTTRVRGLRRRRRRSARPAGRRGRR